MSKEVMQQTLGKIKAARDCHFKAIDVLLFEAEEILEAALAEQPAQRKPLPYNKEDMKDLDVNQRLAFKLGWKSAEEAHGIKEST